MESVHSKIKEYLEKEYPGEPVIIAEKTDITLSGDYDEEWLIVSEKRLSVFSVNNNVVKQLFTTELSKIKKIQPISLIGSGIVEIESASDGHIYKIIAYSQAKDVAFSQMIEDTRNLIEGKPLTKKQDTVNTVCEKCGKTIPQNLNKCPKCVNKSKTLMRILNFSKPHIRLAIYIFILMITGSIFGLATPYMSKLFIDYILKPDRITGIYQYAGYLPWAVLALLLGYSGQLFFGAIQERLSGIMGYRTVYDVRAAIYEKLQTLSLSFFDKHQTGAILARVNQDTSELQRLLVDFMPITLESIIMFFGVGIFLFVLNWQLTCFVLIPVFLTALFLKYVFRRVWIYFHKFFHSRARLSALVNDSISGMRVIKAFGTETNEIEKFDKKSGIYRDTGIELTKKWSMYHPVFHFLILCGTIMVWLIGGKFVIAGKMSVGSVVAYSGYLAMFYRPVFTLIRIVEMITNALTAAERVFDVIDTKPLITDSADAVSIPRINGEIVFKNVDFGYNKFKPIIKELNINVPAGNMIGLVGKSGSGKSTIINLLCRLYDADKGEILIDGINVTKIKYEDLRKQVAVVLQDTFLFNGTIYENILYAKPDATKDEVIEAAFLANAHEFIITKPDGYDTEVGERGNRLSVGERQRVSIARAILRNPRILILDEATSSVDAFTEKKIQDAMMHLVKGRSVVAIAHRLATLRHCNTLFVIENGKCVESGTHEELLLKQGVFYNLVKIQEEISKMKAIER